MKNFLLILLFIFISALLLPFSLAQDPLPDGFDYKNDFQISQLSTNQVHSLNVRKLANYQINILLEQKDEQGNPLLSDAQIKSLTTTQVRNIQIKKVPGSQIPIVMKHFNSKQYKALTPEQVKHLPVDKIPDKHLEHVASDFSSEQYGKMSTKQIKKAYYLVSNLADLNQDKFAEFVESKKSKWNGATILPFGESSCKSPCTLSKEGELATEDKQATLTAYMRDATFRVINGKIFVIGPEEEVVSTKKKVPVKKDGKIVKDAKGNTVYKTIYEKKTIEYSTEMDDLRNIFSNLPPGDNSHVFFADDNMVGVINVEDGKAYYDPESNFGPLTIHGVDTKSPHKVQLLFDESKPEDNFYLRFNERQISGQPGGGTKLDFTDNRYLGFYSNDRPNRFIFTAMNDETVFQLESRKDTFTDLKDGGKQYAPFLHLKKRDGTQKGDLLASIINGNNWVSVLDNSIDLDPIVLNEQSTSTAMEIFVEMDSNDGQVLLMDQENGLKLMNAREDFKFLDMSGNEHCLGKRCSHVFSGTNSKTMQKFIEERGENSPKNLRYVILTDKKKQLSHIVDVVTGKVVKTYFAATGRNPGDKVSGVATDKGVEKLEGNRRTPEGRLRMMTDIKYPNPDRSSYSHRALLAYPRPSDIENAFKKGIINQDERDRYLNVVNNYYNNPNQKNNRAAWRLFSNPSTKIGSNILVHDTKNYNYGWWSAGCYSYKSQDVEEMKQKYTGAGSEFIGIPSTGAGSEVWRPYRNPNIGSKKWRKQQEQNLPQIQADVEAYVAKSGILRPNKQRLASHALQEQQKLLAEAAQKEKEEGAS